MGLATRRQLLAAGIPRRTIASRIASEYLFPVFSGVYLVGRGDLSRQGATLAGVLAAGSGAALGARSAATAWGFMSHSRTIEVLRPAGGKSRAALLRLSDGGARPFLRVIRTGSLPAADIASKAGIPLTTVDRTLWDLVSTLPEDQYRRAFLEADRLGLLDDRALLCRARTSPGHRGRSLILQMALDRIPDVSRARSVLEALVLDLQRQAELPEPQVNVAVLGREADLVWRNERLVVETDGYEFHRGREAFESDALRNVRLRADGWTVLRFTLRMVETRPEEVVDAIRSSLVRSWQ
jgi:very-short-patch-repair endonuclease